MSLTATSCSSSNTILALTITSGPGVVAVTAIRVTITPQSGSEITKDFAPPTTDGAIVMSFFERLTLPDSAEGEASVRADALDSGGTSYAAGVTTANIEKGHTVAAQVKLTVGGPPPPDGGAGGQPGAGGAGGEAGGHGGAGGEAGGHSGAGGQAGHAGGGAGGAQGGAGGHGGAGGRRNNGGAGG